MAENGSFFSHFVYNQLMSASLGLYRLQQVDSQIDRARGQLNTIHKTLENDTELQEALNRVTMTQTNNHHASHSLKNAEAEVDAQKIKIENAESSLYGGRVQNPKELQDLQKDNHAKMFTIKMTTVLHARKIKVSYMVKLTDYKPCFSGLFGLK